MGCRQSKSKEQQDPLPVINMLVAGLSGSGKSTLLNMIKGEVNITKQAQLGIDTFVIDQQLKIITFQVAGKAFTTWKHFYSTSNLVLFVVDCKNSGQFNKVKQIVKQMDQQLPQRAKFVIAFNKIDQFMEKTQRNSIQEQCSKISQFISNSSSNALKNIDNLKFQKLKHQHIICKCSGKYKIGINSLMKQIFSLGMAYVLGKDNLKE